MGSDLSRAGAIAPAVSKSRKLEKEKIGSQRNNTITDGTQEHHRCPKPSDEQLCWLGPLGRGRKRDDLVSGPWIIIVQGIRGIIHIVVTRRSHR